MNKSCKRPCHRWCGRCGRYFAGRYARRSYFEPLPIYWPRPWPSKAALNILEAAARVLDGPEGPNPMSRSSNQPTCTSMSGRSYLS